MSGSFWVLGNMPVHLEVSFFINISFLSHLALLKTKFNSPFSIHIFSHSQTTSFPISVKYQQHTMPFRKARVYLAWVFFFPRLT